MILISDPKLYDRLKFLAQILFPAIGALYFGLAGIWGLPSAQEVIGTITVVDAFLGVLLGLSTSAYRSTDARYAGTVQVGSENENGLQSFHLTGFDNMDAETLKNSKEVVLKVQNNSDTGKAPVRKKKSSTNVSPAPVPEGVNPTRTTPKHDQ